VDKGGVESASGQLGQSNVRQVNQRLLGQLLYLLMMGMRIPETCQAVFKQTSNKPEKLLHLVG
jgi:hypothetical protein